MDFFIKTGIWAFAFNIYRKCSEYFLKNNEYYSILNQKDQLIYSSNIISFLHAFLASILGLYALVKEYNTNEYVEHRDHVTITSGYFLLDTIKHNNIKSVTTLHHVCGLLIIYYINFADKLKIFKLFPYFMLTEISTTLLCLGIHIRGLSHIPKKNLTEYDNKILNKLFISFTLTFFITRIILLPYNFYKIKNEHQDELNKLGKIFEYSVFSLIALQFYWFVKILKILLKNFRKK